MQTVNEPVVVPQIIEIPATKEEKRLSRMIAMVKEGRWCRDYTRSVTDNRHCALGLVSQVVYQEDV